MRIWKPGVWLQGVWRIGSWLGLFIDTGLPRTTRVSSLPGGVLVTPAFASIGVLQANTTASAGTAEARESAEPARSSTSAGTAQSTEVVTKMARC